MVYITHVRTEPGPRAEHVALLGWVETTSGHRGASTVAQMVEYIGMGNRVRIVAVGREPTTMAASTLLSLEADDLLSLPRF